MDKKIRIGTRGSKLALWQANYVAGLLEKRGMETEMVTIETRGDKIQHVSIAKIGSKGVFTEEIEDQLKAGHIDIAVHSAKDMQSRLPEGFELIAFTEREVVNDVILSHNKNISLQQENKEIVMGTSSTRRVATLKRWYPHVKTTAIRGNLQTRIAKMEEGQCDALLLAYAGVYRMGYEDMIIERLSLDQFIPAVGQGSIAIQTYKNLDVDKKTLIRNYINHTATEYCLSAERAYLKKLQGGCSIPVFALATLNGEEISITGGIISLDGQTLLKRTLQGNKNEAKELGLSLAEEILLLGGDKILAGIRKEQGGDAPDLRIT